MPTISEFYGMYIQMYWNAHAPPHFHVRYAEFMAKYEIKPLVKVYGNLPASTERLVLQWALLYQADLLVSWEQCRSGATPSKIPGLQ